MTTKAQQPKLTNAERWGRDGCRVMGLKPDDLWVQKAQQPSPAAMDAAREIARGHCAVGPENEQHLAESLASIIDRHLAAERKEVREVLRHAELIVPGLQSCTANEGERRRLIRHIQEALARIGGE